MEIEVRYEIEQTNFRPRLRKSKLMLIQSVCVKKVFEKLSHFHPSNYKALFSFLITFGLQLILRYKLFWK